MRYRFWLLTHRLAGWWRARLARPTLGQRGEALAARYLLRKGYRIVIRGSRMPGGEIDLVALDGRTIVFVEVKTRTSADHGHPAEAVDDEKQRRLTRLALRLLKRHGLLDHPARFDVVAVTWPENRRRPTIEHFINAFPAADLKQRF
ncbi:MAG: YraN family protein [Planctomycetota bacterium]